MPACTGSSLANDVLGEDLDQGVLRVLEDDGLGDAGRNAAAALALDAVPRQLARHIGKITPGRDLKRQPRKRIGDAGLERDRLEALLARKHRPLAVALEQSEADNLGIVGDLSIEIGRGQRGMAEPAHVDHLSASDRLTVLPASAPMAQPPGPSRAHV